MYSPRFDKRAFKHEVTENVKTLFRKTIEEATPQQLYQAVSYAVKEAIIDDWIATQRTYDKEDPKMVYYMSMEFLLGRALGNNLINMTAYKEVKEATGLSDRDLNAAIGWLAREGKIQFINLPDHEDALYIELNLYIG